MNSSIREQLEFLGFKPSMKLPKRKDPLVMVFMGKDTMKRVTKDLYKGVVFADHKAIPRVYQWL